MTMTKARKTTTTLQYFKQNTFAPSSCQPLTTYTDKSKKSPDKKSFGT